MSESRGRPADRTIGPTRPTPIDGFRCSWAYELLSWNSFGCHWPNEGYEIPAVRSRQHRSRICSLQRSGDCEGGRRRMQQDDKYWRWCLPELHPNPSRRRRESVHNKAHHAPKIHPYPDHPRRCCTQFPFLPFPKPDKIKENQSRISYTSTSKLRPLSHMKLHLTAHPGTVCRAVLLVVVRWTRPWWSRELAENLESPLGSVLFGIVDVLSVVPVAGREILASDVDRAAPRCASACWSVNEGVERNKMG